MSLVVSKAIRLIDLVAEGVDNLADISEASEMSRSTTHRLLATLVEHNYLKLEAKRYTLGYRLLELGEQKKRSLSFVNAMHEVLARYAQLTSDTIHLAILDGKDMLLVDRVPGSRQLQINSFVGQRAAACMTAVGKVLIGQTDARGWPGYLVPLRRDYPKTPAQLLEEFRTAQLENYAVDYNECDIGTCGVASSFRVNERLLAAVSINGATAYFPGTRLEEMADMTLRMAGELAEIASQLPAGQGLSDIGTAADALPRALRTTSM
ncbi:IclR family transcriptional regulator [Devosia sp.]|uniref:IclR family transcriptional regulator n=1 Tax=Devosia sp. TaxID=1871048 RepID=UPI002EE17E73